MAYTTFSNKTNARRTLFFGDCLDVARYDEQAYPVFEQLCESQISMFWRPQEVNLTRDRIDFYNMSEVHKDIFVQNLQYQIMLDSVQGRAPNIALLPLVSAPELEAFIVAWSFMETIHSRSYTHIIRALFDEPHKIFDKIVLHPEIAQRAKAVTQQYDDLIFLSQCYSSQGEGEYIRDGKKVKVDLYSLKKALVLTLYTINALEAIRFHVSFACSFAFAENSKLEGCCKIMKFIARDEATHTSATAHMINSINSSDYADQELTKILQHAEQEATDIFLECVEQEKIWAAHIFSKGNIPGLNTTQLCDYIDYLAYTNMKKIDLVYPIRKTSHCIPWIDDYLKSLHVQVAPQEAEVSSYLSGQINTQLSAEDLDLLKL